MTDRNEHRQQACGFRGRGLIAHERGAMIPRAFSGTVIARFEHAVTIAVSGESLIMALVTRREGMSARALLLPALPRELRTGAAVCASDGRARFGEQPRGRSSEWVARTLTPAPAAQATAAAGGEIDFAGAPWYYGHLSAAPVTSCRSEQMVAPVPPPPALIAGLLEIVREHGRGGGLLGLLDRRRENVFSAFAARLLGIKGARRSTAEYEKLVGLGGGLTPAGDDFVMGVLAAEELGAPTLIDRDAVSRRLAHAESTTVVSATMLRLALAGMFPAYLTAVGAELTAVPAAMRDAERRGGPARASRELRPTVLRALEYGHSSGTDALVGLLWGLTGARVAAFGSVPV